MVFEFLTSGIAHRIFDLAEKFKSPLPKILGLFYRNPIFEGVPTIDFGKTSKVVEFVLDLNNTPWNAQNHTISSGAC
jgi:hypothetical protein